MGKSLDQCFIYLANRRKYISVEAAMCLLDYSGKNAEKHIALGSDFTSASWVKSGEKQFKSKSKQNRVEPSQNQLSELRSKVSDISKTICHNDCKLMIKAFGAIIHPHGKTLNETFNGYFSRPDPDLALASCKSSDKLYSSLLEQIESEYKQPDISLLDSLRIQKTLSGTKLIDELRRHKVPIPSNMDIRGYKSKLYSQFS